MLSEATSAWLSCSPPAFFILSLITIELCLFLEENPGNSLVVQWLGFGAFTAVAWVQPLVGELRSSKLCGMAKIKIKTMLEK